LGTIGISRLTIELKFVHFNKSALSEKRFAEIAIFIGSERALVLRAQPRRTMKKTTLTSTSALRPRALLIGVACLLATLGITSSALGALIAYEGFDYTVGSQSIGRSGIVTDWNGGTGWAGPWEDIPPDPNGVDPFVNPASSTLDAASTILAGSLGYTDLDGRILVTSGNMLHNSGTNLNATSRPARNLAAFAITNGTTVWISFVGKRTGASNETTGGYDRGANFSLFNTNTWGTNTSGRLAFGESSGTVAAQTNDTWGVVPLGTGSLRRHSTYHFTNQALVVVRIDFHDDDDPTTVSDTNNFDDLYIWLNPTNLAVEPNISLAFTNILSTETNGAGVPNGIDMAFNRIVMFAGNLSGANPAAEWLFDELRIGNSYADVVPFVGGPPSISPRFTAIVPSGGGMSLTVTGAPNTTLTMELNLNLSTPTWNNIGSVNLNGSGIGTFNDTDPSATNQARFYRAKP
jgi:hypothetical protein